MKNSDPIPAQMTLLCRGHKCKTFEEAPLAILDRRARVLTELPHYEPAQLYDEPYMLLHPTDAFIVVTGLYFVLELTPDEWYLVDTQGYPYCRRICRVVFMEMD